VRNLANDSADCSAQGTIIHDSHHEAKLFVQVFTLDRIKDSVDHQVEHLCKM
jgi:hypothetical protein